MARKMLYFDCGSGISGDMTVASLIDLGADRTTLAAVLASLPENEGFTTKISRVKKSAIECCDFNVILDEVHENHDHDMEYLYGRKNPYEEHEHSHEHGNQEHTHDHEAHSHSHTHSHTHGHRTMAEIESILVDCEMTDRALELAGRIFEILAEAEAKAHGIPVDQVHFHEVGAIDSIVDIVSAAVCMDSICTKYGIEDVIIPRLAEGTGTVRTQHGVLPVPVPAVLNIVQATGLNLEVQDVKGEYVTPTGAAFAAAVRTSDKLPKRFRVLATGLGAGKRVQELPGILRAMIIESDDTESSGTIVKLESNIDDCTGEVLGYTMERLFAAGARDVHYVPVFMKKNRPAWQLNVICLEEDVEKLEEIIFTETTTIGIRKFRVERDTLAREVGQVETEYGKIRTKIVHIGDAIKEYPEYESVAAIAREQKVPFQVVFAAAQTAIRS